MLYQLYNPTICYNKIIDMKQYKKHTQQTQNGQTRTYDESHKSTDKKHYNQHTKQYYKHANKMHHGPTNTYEERLPRYLDVTIPAKNTENITIQQTTYVQLFDFELVPMYDDDEYVII